MKTAGFAADSMMKYKKLQSIFWQIASANLEKNYMHDADQFPVERLPSLEPTEIVGFWNKTWL